jgi:acyl-CoA thioester hydrolase
MVGKRLRCKPLGKAVKKTSAPVLSWALHKEKVPFTQTTQANSSCFITDWSEQKMQAAQNTTFRAGMNGFEHTTQVRVRYAETDRMGYVYYGNYAAYYEVGRVEALRALGCTYRSLEDSGIMLPVRDFSIHYKKPAFYDELLTVTTRIPEMPSNRIRFDYEIFNESGDLLNQGSTILVFVSAANGRPTKPPESFLDTLKPFFSV